MLPFWIVAIASFIIFFPLICILSMMRVPSYHTYKKIQLIPGPKGLPFFGLGIEVFKLSFAELFSFFKSVIDVNPPIVKAWLMGIPMVFIGKPEYAEVIMSSMHHIEKGVEYDFMKNWLNEGLLTSKGKKWRSRRKLLTPAFHFKILENNVLTINSNAKHLVETLLSQNGAPVDILSYISLCTLDVICETAMGISINAQDHQASEYVKSIKEVSEGIVFRIMNIYLKNGIFSILPIGISFNRTIKKLHKYTESIIIARREIYMKTKLNSHDISTSKPGKQRFAFLDMLIELEKSQNAVSNNADIREEVDTFMFEGHDTTSSALTFALLMLGLHQEIQETAYHEQFEIFGNDYRHVERKDLQEMVYLEKVIKETLRLFPSVPYYSRKLTQDIRLGEKYEVPAGSNAVMIPYIMHRDPNIYPDPETFDPERFTPDEIAKRHPFAYIPFSAGPRNCIGQKFAMMELKIVISTVLRSCHIQSVTQREDLVLMPMLVLRNEKPIYIKFLPRINT